MPPNRVFQKPKVSKPCRRCGTEFKLKESRQFFCSEPCRIRYQHMERLKRVYGLSEEDYEKMLLKQNGVCALCGGKPEAVDHCHKTGRIRGLLCRVCNAALNRVEIPGWAEKAILYLK